MLLLIVIYWTVTLFAASVSTNQRIYYGEAELVQQLLTNSSQWTYVQENVDGFYVNFIEMDDILTVDELSDFFQLFKNKSAYYESDADPHHQPLEKDKTAIDVLHRVGWNITYTSQNYGWTVERDEILGYYNLTEHVRRRPDFVQLGPWTLSGNISNNAGTGPYSNAQYRAWINQTDGVSTDGPLGFWQINFQQVREGSYSAVQFAHRLGKSAAVMLCPYGAGVPTYNSTRDFLTVGISAIQGHEDNDADPDIWIIFEYADASIPAVPEQINDYPANSTTGMAFYALKHRDGIPKTLDLYVDEGKVGQYVFVRDSNSVDMTIHSNVPVGTARNYTLQVADYSSWLDYAAQIRAFAIGNPRSAWKISYTIDGVDITSDIGSTDGFVFVRKNRLQPKTIQSINISFFRTSTIVNNMTLIIELSPHRGSAVMDSLRILC
ncbi:unnamed protein product [Adineta ricciae]|uniref:Uncharacterized protein n=1 Tax=Adineta ricciae TaxID=249248 RepID=A0A815YSC8_ADIRI|nr:unnamed protein product [Adineta ricciae]CAF1574294.1 unnamed protein product [Adineta ricciae]